MSASTSTTSPNERSTTVNANQQLWEQGDFTRIAESMRASGEELVSRLGFATSARVLDVGCGDGTTALPAASRAREVIGVDIARNLVAAGNRRAAEAGVTNLRFEHGDAGDFVYLEDDAFDETLSVFGAMFAPRPDAVARELVRVTRPGGRITMGNWIPGDPTLVAEILRISSQYSPPPPAGFVSPMTWGAPEQVLERFGRVGIAPDRITCDRDTWVFATERTTDAFLADFRAFYGPTMNAFAAAEGAGRADELWHELSALFATHNFADDPSTSTRIAATYLRVTVSV
jgi:ubiquinone/menaquinone biosynthesis C-methylase UbiE